MFCFHLAEQLGQSVEWVMTNISVVEMKAWAKYYAYQAEQRKKK